MCSVVVASMKAVLKTEKKAATPLDRGYNGNIEWMTLADAEKESRARYIEKTMINVHSITCMNTEAYSIQMSATGY